MDLQKSLVAAEESVVANYREWAPWRAPFEVNGHVYAVRGYTFWSEDPEVRTSLYRVEWEPRKILPARAAPARWPGDPLCTDTWHQRRPALTRPNHIVGKADAPNPRRRRIRTRARCSPYGPAVRAGIACTTIRAGMPCLQGPTRRQFFLSQRSYRLS